MKHIKKILIIALLWVFFWSVHTYAFLWEDLGIDLYGEIDRNFKDLEQKQYEYELTGQGEGTLNEVLAPIFADYGISCNVNTPEDIDTMLWDDNISEIVSRCWGDNENVPALLAERVSNALRYIRETYTQKAETKAQKTFEVERIGLYSDGNIENSPFDLVEDLIQIDTIIFTEELEYEWVARNNANEDFANHLLWEDTNIAVEEPEEEIIEDEEESVEEDDVLDPDEILWNDIIEYLDYHNYVCTPENQSGLDDTITGDIIWDIEWYGPYVSNPTYWEYPEWITPLGGWWTGPTLGWGGLDWNYSPVRDEFACDSWFCIVIEFEKSDYGLAGWETMTIETVLNRAWKHLDKAGNASLTQRKQTTNNFELGSIIENLPDMLRWFWVEVSSKPVPILDLETDWEEALTWDRFEIENLVRKYYKNIWLDYDRQNDLSNYNSREYEQKIIQTAWWMPIEYVEMRSNQLKVFQNALRENNRIIAQEINNEIISQDLEQYSHLFSELEIFTAAIENFVFAYSWNLSEMKEIPTRSP